MHIKQSNKEYYYSTNVIFYFKNLKIHCQSICTMYLLRKESKNLGFTLHIIDELVSNNN